METQAIVIESVADIYEGQEIAGKLVTDKAGKQWKVKKGKGGKLKDRWHVLEVGKAIQLTIGQFTPPGKTQAFPFVEDFELIADIFKQEATLKAQTEQGRDRLDTEEVRCRSYALAYAKDLAVSERIDVKDITTKADEFYHWLKNGTETITIAPQAEAIQTKIKEALKRPSDNIKTLTQLMGWIDAHPEDWAEQYSNANAVLKDVKGIVVDGKINIPNAIIKLREYFKWED